MLAEPGRGVHLMVHMCLERRDAFVQVWARRLGTSSRMRGRHEAGTSTNRAGVIATKSAPVDSGPSVFRVHLPMAAWRNLPTGPAGQPPSARVFDDDAIVRRSRSTTRRAARGRRDDLSGE
jgi:hypothetical protein